MGQSLSKERDGDNGAEEGFIPIRGIMIKNKLRKKVPIGFGLLILLLVTVIVIIGIVIVTDKLSHRHQSSYTYRPTCF